MRTSAIAPTTDAAQTERGELRKIQHKAVEEVRRPLRAFLADRSADCSSGQLQEAERRATETAGALADAMRPDYLATSGVAVLDVAHAATKRGCARHAKELYHIAIRNFAGLGYAELRAKC